MTEGICRVNCFVRLLKPRYHRGMTRSCLLLFTLALSVLSACAPPPLWYRSGISPTRLSQDLTACRVAANVGAGDAALAGLLLAREAGLDDEDALATAVAHGSAAASLPGSTPPAPADVAALERPRAQRLDTTAIP